MAHKTVVVKIGTQVIGRPDGAINLARLESLLRPLAQLWEEGVQTLIVTSGAVGLGRHALGVSGELTVTEMQALAACGQAELVTTYQKILQQLGLRAGQVLVTSRDLANRKSYLALRETLSELLKRKVVPIINENDTVSTDELEFRDGEKNFGDNDMLSALIAAKVNADLLIILTNTAGIYTANPELDPTAKRVEILSGIEGLRSINVSGKSQMGRGGMSSKLKAIQTGLLCGVSCAVASGAEENVIEKIIRHPDLTKPLEGVTFAIAGARPQSKKRWIGHSTGHRGTLVVNKGAAEALINRGASLLPVGVIELKGSFNAGEAVSIVSEDGVEIGRGLVKLGSEELKEIITKGSTKSPECVHRDDLVLFKEKD